MIDRPGRPQGRTEAENEEMREAAERRMLLEGTWRPLLRQHIERQLGPLRARMNGEPDISANLFGSTIDQTCTLFDDEPFVAGDDAIKAAFDDAGWDDGIARPTFTIFTRDCYWYDTAPNNPNRIVRVGLAKRRPIPEKPSERAWFWDVWDIRDPEAPSFRIFTNDMQRDVTRDQGVDPAEWSGAKYPVRRAGKPIIPGAFYRLRGGPSNRMPNGQSEVVFATLQVGLLWTAAVHGLLRASWFQRVLLNGKVKGGTTTTTAGTGVRSVEADPMFVLQVDGEGASIAEWGSPVDIEKAEKFCRMYEARCAVHFGLSPADLVIESLNPASGASITVSQRGKRTLQARQRPQFARGDRELVAVVAAMLRAHSIAADETKVTIRYRGVALTPEERTQVIGYCVAEMKAGLMTREDAWLELHPGASPEQAEAAIKLVDADAKRRAVVAQLDQERDDDADDEATPAANDTAEEAAPEAQ
jgi:hypothetical protein